MHRTVSKGFAFTLLFSFAASPASANFFDDLSFALNKAGQKIESTARSITGRDKDGERAADDASDSQGVPPQQKQNSQQNQIIVHPRITSPSASTYTNTPKKSLQTAVRGDDAPPPHAAPHRAQVQTVAALDPLPGYRLAPERHQSSQVSSSILGLTQISPAAGGVITSTTDLSAPEKSAKTVSGTALNTAPVIAPSANDMLADRRFDVVFAKQSIILDDKQTRLQDTKPNAATRDMVKAVAAQLQMPGRRLELTAEAIVQGGRTGEARLRAFMRARLLQKWIEAEGARTTQIDLKVGGGDKDEVRLRVYDVKE